IVVDDFESYTDYSPNKIFQTWIDGWGYSKDEVFPNGHEGNGTGAQVGGFDAPFAEQTIVHGGRQSMPMTYSNAAPLTRSETDRSFTEPQNWTLYGAGTLTLYFRGTLDNKGQLYVKINSTKVPYNGDAGDIGTMVWQPWSIDLSAVSGNMRSVTKLTIGVEGAEATGVLYIDDIRLYPKPPEASTGAEPNRANLVAYYTFDGNVNDSSANGYHGVMNSEPAYVPGVRGQALQFDGVDDHVRVATQDRLNPKTGDFSVTCWAYLDPQPGTSGTTNWDLAVTKRENGSKGWYVGADRNQGTATQAGWKFMLGPSTSALRVDTPFVLVPLDEWVFVAAVLDRAQNVHKISVDGGLTWATAKPPTLPITSTKDLTIGYDLGPNNYWFHGNIDEVRIYDKALTNDEVAWIALH
ncbi:MAG: LamG domain-containing protein, partial [Planctomycetaceae bacterium]